MKKALLLALLWAFNAKALIVEIASLAQVAEKVQPGALVLFDLDNTLMKPTQSLGSHQWYDHLVARYKKEMSKEEAHRKARLLWDRVQEISSMTLVESLAPKVIEQLREKGHTVLALTARTTRRYHDTHRQLKDLNLSFAWTGLGDQLFDTPTTSGFFGGVLFAENNPKGEVLNAFLKKANLTPPQVVAIDDRKPNLESLEKSLDKKIEFLGLRYGAEDAAVKNYDPKLTQIQERFFEQILSDDVAQKLISTETPASN